MEEYQISQGKKLRCGYTTGSCATAAAKAATKMLLTGERVETVIINTPKGIVLNLETEEILVTKDSVTCAIRKDSGDDPDDTNGILIFATVERKLEPGIELIGGVGIGAVTKPGLSCAVGGPAINPIPRKMIAEEVSKVMQETDYKQGLKIAISAPAGVEIAKKTFNPRLGIVDGISILGTSGIVEPMSDKALIETMYVELDSRAAAGDKDLLVFFGNYGEDFTRDMLGLDVSNAVTCSNFVGELLDYAVYKGFESLLLIGHSGKLVKLAQGVMNTHSKYADCRAEAIALYAMLNGSSSDIGREILQTPTTDEAVKILKREMIFESVINCLTEKIDFYMQHRVHEKIKTAALMFSNVYGILGKTQNADELLKLHLKDKKEG